MFAPKVHRLLEITRSFLYVSFDARFDLIFDKKTGIFSIHRLSLAFLVVATFCDPNFCPFFWFINLRQRRRKTRFNGQTKRGKEICDDILRSKFLNALREKKKLRNKKFSLLGLELRTQDNDEPIKSFERNIIKVSVESSFIAIYLVRLIGAVIARVLGNYSTINYLSTRFSLN